MIAKVVLEKYLAFSSGILDYAVPEELQSDLKVGQLVKVPFQKTFYNALVVAVKALSCEPQDVSKSVSFEDDSSKKSPLKGLGGVVPKGEQEQSQKQLDISRETNKENLRFKSETLNQQPMNLKNIEQILYTKSLINEYDLLIAQEIADYYLCSISQVLKLFLPKNFWRNKIHKPKVIKYFLNPEIDFSEKKIRGKNQIAIIEFLKEFGKANLEKIRKLPEYSSATLKKLTEKGWIIVEVKNLSPSDLVTEIVNMKALNSEQKNALKAIQNSEKPVLLHGITGSGKTELYLHTIRKSLEKGKTALVLVPEIVLTTQIVEYFKNVFGDAVGVIHSKLSDGEKEKIWWQIKLGQKKVIIGSRSALFYPYPKLGVIVIDEAHEWYYKNDQTPRYHTHKVAELLAKYHNSKLILGTATPRVDDYWRAINKSPLRGLGGVVPQGQQIKSQNQKDTIQESCKKTSRFKSETLNQHYVENVEFKNEKVEVQNSGQAGMTKKLPTTNYQLLTLKKRIYEDEISGKKFTRESKLSEVKIIDLKEEFQKKNFTPFSDVLIQELKQTLENEEQALLFLNKRGTSSGLICRECGYVANCKACDVGLTYHQKGNQGKLICHYCGRMQDPFLLCPECQSPQIKFVGAGTQKIERDLKKLFPKARIARVDRDTTAAKDAHTQLYTQLKNEEVDIVIGTQIIAKGFDLPKVSLVGILNADVGLNVPDFRSGEKIFHVLTQVSGRAGRRAKQGKVLLQTYNPDNFILQAIAKHDYTLFYQNEIKMREELKWPPFSSVVKLTCVDYSIQKVLQKVDSLKKVLLNLSKDKNIQILSAPALIPKMHNKYHWNIILKGENPDEIIRQIRLPVGWRVDRDPVQVS